MLGGLLFGNRPGTGFGYRAGIGLNVNLGHYPFAIELGGRQIFFDAATVSGSYLQFGLLAF